MIKDRLEVTILGSGTCVPSLVRSSCAALVSTPKTHILLDLGVGTLHRLLACGKTLADIDLIFLSHFHPDHTAELVPFLFASKYGGPPHRKKPLTIMGGPGFKVFFNGLKRVYGDWISLNEMPLHIVEQATNLTTSDLADGLQLQTAPVNHNPESLALKITGSGQKSVVYSGDTDYCDELISLARNADLMICESAFPDQLKVIGHLTPGLAGKMATAANVKRLMLTHFYPACENADIRAQARRTYAGPLTLAKDRLRVTL